MKKIMIMLFLIAGILPAIRSINTINILSQSGVPGDTIELSVELSNTDNIVAAEILIPISEDIKYVNGSALLNSARSNGHQISASQNGDDLRIYIYNLGLQPISGSSGELVTCSLVIGKEPKIQNITPNVILSDANGNEVTSSVSNATITILASKMQVVNKTIDYGHIPIRSSYHQNLSIFNEGTASMTIDSISFSSDRFSTSQLPMTIQSGRSKNIDIEYNPTNRGSISEKLVIYSNAVNGQFKTVNTVTLTADPYSVNEIHVGGASGMNDDTVDVHLTMNNMDPIVAGEISFVIPSTLLSVENGFSLSDRATDHIAFSRHHGDTLSLYFYSPTNSPLSDDDGEIGIVRFKLNGVSGGYYLSPIDVKLSTVNEENVLSQAYDNIVWIQSADIVVPSNADFGTSSILDTATVLVPITNVGHADLVINNVTFLAEGYHCETELPLTIQYSQTENLEISYVPSVEGAFNTTMQVYSNDPDTRMASVRLSGNIFEPNELSISSSRNDSNFIIEVNLDNYSNISAVQFDVKGVPSSAIVSGTSRLSSHSAMQTPISEGIRVLAFSMSNAYITDHSGKIFDIAFPVANIDSVHISINSIMLSSVSGTNKSTQDSVTFDGEVLYRIKFANFNDSVLQSEDLTLGSVPSYSGETPTKPSDVQYSYEFNGWEPSIVSVQSDMVYIAVYDNILNEYIVTFENYDGTMLQQSSWQYGTTPVYSGPTPTKPSSTMYNYQFKGWHKSLSPVVGDETYIAEFDSTLTEYSITFENYDGTILQQSDWEYGTMPVYSGAIPTKPSIVGYNFTFADWTPTIVPVSGNATYTATYDSTLAEYTVSVIYSSECGSVIGEGTYQYLDEVILTVTANPGYVFSGWEDGTTDNPRTVIVTGDLTLMAYFTQEEEVENVESNIRFAVNNKTLYVSLESENTIRLFTMNGQLIDETKTSFYEKELLTGVYLFIVENQIFKIVIK